MNSKNLTYYSCDLKKHFISQDFLNDINSKSSVKIVIGNDQLEGKLPMLSFHDKSTDVDIILPFLSTCGRFKVDPIVEYKLTKEQLQLFQNETNTIEIDYDKYIELVESLGF